jgi:hypothetical protein
MNLPSYRWRLAHVAALWADGVGQPVFSMLKGNPEFLVHLDDEAQFERVQTAAAYARTHITGEIQQPLPAPGTLVAIPVNGRVTGTTWTFRLDGRCFSALVPESVPVDGKNTVRVYAVRDVAGTNHLARLRGASIGPGHPERQDGGAR